MRNMITSTNDNIPNFINHRNNSNSNTYYIQLRKTMGGD